MLFLGLAAVSPTWSSILSALAWSEWWCLGGVWWANLISDVNKQMLRCSSTHFRTIVYDPYPHESLIHVARGSSGFINHNPSWTVASVAGLGSLHCLSGIIVLLSLGRSTAEGIVDRSPVGVTWDLIQKENTLRQPWPMEFSCSTEWVTGNMSTALAFAMEGYTGQWEGVFWMILDSPCLDANLLALLFFGVHPPCSGWNGMSFSLLLGFMCWGQNTTSQEFC